MAAPVPQSANHTSSSGTASVPPPSGITNGDLLIGYCQTEGTTPTPPPGFTLVISGTNGSNPTYMWSKIAASESGNYVFSASGNLDAGVLRITGVDQTTPVAQTSSGSTGAPTTAYSISGITPTSTNVLLLHCPGWTNDTRTITTGPAVANNNPSPWTRFLALDTGGSGQVATIYCGAYSPTSATGVATATFSGSTAWGGFLVAIQPPQGTTIAVSTVTLTLAEPAVTGAKAMLASVVSLILGVFGVTESNSDSKWARVQKDSSSFSTVSKSALPTYTTSTKSSAPPWTDQTKT